MSARPAKFTFGQDFSPAQPSRRRVEDFEDEIARLKERVEAARAEGHALGYAAGKADREAVEAARLAAAVEKLVAAGTRIVGTLDLERETLEREAILLAVTTARTLARGLVEREPVHEIARVAGEALANLRGAPHIVLRVSPDHVEAVEARLKRVAFERGFEGRLVVLGDPDEAAGDCRIEWADGGVVRNTPALEQAIAAAVSSYLDARAAGETE